MVDRTRLDKLMTQLSVDMDKKKITHRMNAIARFLPFGTREPERPIFTSGFLTVVGEMVRQVRGVKTVETLKMDSILEAIISQVKVADKDVIYLKEILEHFLTDQSGQMQLFHPYLLNYVMLSEGKRKSGEKEIANFMKDVFFENVKDITFFSNKGVEGVFEKLILANLENLEEENGQKRYSSVLPGLKRTFEEDYAYLSKKQEYFLNHIDTFFAYYYFTYIVQISVKFNQKRANYENLTPLFYNLDWESPGKSRWSYTEGYLLVKESNRNLLNHMNVLDHLNILAACEHACTYEEIKERIDQMDEASRGDFLETLAYWIGLYREITDQEKVNLMSKNYDKLVETLKDSLKISEATKSRYPKYINEIGTKYFLKQHGSLGYLLNCNQELLLMASALVVKDEPVSVKRYFEGLEERGIYLDKYSKQRVVEMLDKWNLIDKKSDSGDAQYVKTIL